MPSTCCVPGCFNVGGFSFPKKHDLRQIWIARVSREMPGKRKWLPNNDDRVCELHFASEDIIMHLATNSDRVWRTLRPGAIPKKPNAKEKDSAQDEARRERLKRRHEVLEELSVDEPIQAEEEEDSNDGGDEAKSPQLSHQAEEASTYDLEEEEQHSDHEEHQISHKSPTESPRCGSDDDSNSTFEDEANDLQKSDQDDDDDLPDVVLELDLEDEEKEANENHDKEKEEHPLLFGNFSVDGLTTLPGGFRYYTSFEDRAHFDYVFNCLGPASYHLKYKSKKLEPREEFLLMLMKLRQNKDDLELSWMFGICRTTVARVFKTWLNFVYFQLKELNIWPSRQLVDTYMPSDFKKKFPKTRVVLDGSEVPIDKPSNPKDQSATWSTYKNCNTLKIMVGISPRGDVSYISEVYGGATSDRAIVERSDLLKEGKFDKEDSVMADRGFVVQDLFCLQQVHVNIPTVMRNMVQLPPDKVIRDRRLSSKRVHVERIIGLAKTYKILREDLNHNYTPLGGRILYVCFALVNFRPTIVDNNA